MIALYVILFLFTVSATKKWWIYIPTIFVLFLDSSLAVLTLPLSMYSVALFIGILCLLINKKFQELALELYREYNWIALLPSYISVLLSSFTSVFIPAIYLWRAYVVHI